MSDLYVRRKTCGCRIDVSRSVDELALRRPLRAAEHWISTLSVEQAESVPDACNTCEPNRQERLL